MIWFESSFVRVTVDKKDKQASFHRRADSIKTKGLLSRALRPFGSRSLPVALKVLYEMGNPNRVRNESIPASVFSALPFSSLCQGKAQHRVCHCDVRVWRHSMPESEERKIDPSRRQTCFGGMIFTDAHRGRLYARPPGTVLTGATVGAPNCSRASFRVRPLPDCQGPPTVASFLKQQGYHTAIIGKHRFQVLDPKSGKGIRGRITDPPVEPFPMAPPPGLRSFPGLPSRAKHGGRDRRRRGRRP